jgi:putative ABC transport system permease protein
MLSRSRGVAAVAVLTLALAIGANSIVFSFANPLLIRPLPIREPERVIGVFAVDPRRGNDRAEVSLPDFIDWQSRATTVEDLSAFEGASFTLTGRGDPVRLRAMRASADFFRAWGGDIRRLVLSQGTRLAVAGVGLGLLLGLGLAQAAKRVLYRVSAADPLTLLEAVAAVSALALLATYLPARKATHVDPLSALKSE